MTHKLRWSTAVALTLVIGLGCPVAAGAAQPGSKCNLRLAVTFTPDVPNTQDPGFLAEILSSPGYRLTWLSGTATQATMQLTGPGPSSECQNALNNLSRDTHVLNVKVLQPGQSA